MPVTRRHRNAHVRAEQRRFGRARDGQTWQPRELPRFYCLERFGRLLGEARAAHAALLGPDELDFLDAFETLPFASRTRRTLGIASVARPGMPPAVAAPPPSGPDRAASLAARQGRGGAIEFVR